MMLFSVGLLFMMHSILVAWLKPAKPSTTLSAPMWEGLCYSVLRNKSQTYHLHYLNKGDRCHVFFSVTRFSRHGSTKRINLGLAFLFLAKIQGPDRFQINAVLKLTNHSVTVTLAIQCGSASSSPQYVKPIKFTYVEYIDLHLLCIYLDMWKVSRHMA